MSNTIGRIFRVTTFGESHGAAIGAVIDGCPPKLKVSLPDIQSQLDRRKPGSGKFSSARGESDQVRIISGIEGGVTLGSPITMIIDNQDVRPSDYKAIRDIPRPSHADFTYKAKYGVTAVSGGGRASARETVARVAAGGMAEQFIASKYGIEVVAWVSSVGSVMAQNVNYEKVTRQKVDFSEIRCPDLAAEGKMKKIIESVISEKDSIGGTVTCVCRGVPAGYGEPVFGKLHAMLASAMLSIPAARGFEIGAGFAASEMKGSEHNDMFIEKNGRLGTKTNRSGGIQGGISNGEIIVFRVAFKPTATIAREQKSFDYDGKPREFSVKGRHDPCIVPRAVPVVEAMATLVLADAALLI